MKFDKPLTDKMKAHLTQDELDRIEHIRPQMTYTTTHFIKLLINERIQKAALLVACKSVEFVWIKDSMVEVCPWCHGTKLLGHNENCQRQSAIEQAGESGE